MIIVESEMVDFSLNIFKFKKNRNRKKSSIVPENDACCCICLENMENFKTNIKTKCGHLFHQKCLCTSLHTSVNCPYCRTDLIHNETILYMKKNATTISILFNDTNIPLREKTEYNIEYISRRVDEIKDKVCEKISDKINYIVEKNVMFVFILLPIGYTLIAVYFGVNLVVYVVIKPVLYISKFICRRFAPVNVVVV